MIDESFYNRRSSPRIPVCLVVTAQPVSGQREPLGDLLNAVTVDISRGGASFVSDHPLLSDLAILEIVAAESDQTIRLLAERIRCRRNGAMFEIAVRFVEKLT